MSHSESARAPDRPKSRRSEAKRRRLYRRIAALIALLVLLCLVTCGLNPQTGFNPFGGGDGQEADRGGGAMAEASRPFTGAGTKATSGRSETLGSARGFASGRARSDDGLAQTGRFVRDPRCDLVLNDPPKGRPRLAAFFAGCPGAGGSGGADEGSVSATSAETPLGAADESTGSSGGGLPNGGSNGGPNGSPGPNGGAGFAPGGFGPGPGAGVPGMPGDGNDPPVGNGNPPGDDPSESPPDDPKGPVGGSPPLLPENIPDILPDFPDNGGPPSNLPPDDIAGPGPGGPYEEPPYDPGRPILELSLDQGPDLEDPIDPTAEKPVSVPEPGSLELLLAALTIFLLSPRLFRRQRPCPARAAPNKRRG